VIACALEAPVIHGTRVGDSERHGSEDWTIQRLLRWAAEDFQKRGFPTPRLEADLLLGHVLHLDRVQLLVQAHRSLTPDELTRYRELIRRRRDAEPIAYILGNREFYGRRFHVDRRVLVPRPETELLVEVALKRTAHRNLWGRALDLCTGSGCVAITFCLERPTWQTTATDVSVDALCVAAENALALGAVWGLRLRSGDLFGAVDETERFELITANPPYVPSAELETLMPDVRNFEPHLALDGGPTGLDLYARLAKDAALHLVPGGVLALEVGAGQAPDVEKLLLAAGFYDAQRARDHGGHERVVSARRALSVRSCELPAQSAGSAEN
jgi:release factor glutamine methyltransferase